MGVGKPQILTENDKPFYTKVPLETLSVEELHELLSYTADDLGQAVAEVRWLRRELMLITTHLQQRGGKESNPLNEFIDPIDYLQRTN